MPKADIARRKALFDADARLSWVLAGLAGLSLLVAGWAMLITATAVCLVVTGYTYLHLDRHRPLAE